VGLEEHLTHTQGKLLSMLSSSNVAAAVAKDSRLNQEASNKANTEVGDQSSRTNQTLLKCIGAKPPMPKQLLGNNNRTILAIYCLFVIIFNV